MASLDILAHAAFETLRISVPTLIDSWRGRLAPERCDQRLASWAERLLAFAELDLEVVGRSNVGAGPMIVMSNHQSYYDVPVLFQALAPLRLRMFAKAELFRIPVWSSAMRQAGFVPIERSNGKAALRSLDQAAERLTAGGVSVWIAPEGTRSTSGAVAEFRRGGFLLALQTRLPILPVCVDGTLAVHQAGSSTVHRGKRATVTIGAPIQAGEYDRKSLKQLMARVRQAIAAPLLSGPQAPKGREQPGTAPVSRELAVEGVSAPRAQA